ncbi:MAG: hypothetical protein ACFFHD_02900, partial [Promethearchaeota archaeon]
MLQNLKKNQINNIEINTEFYLEEDDFFKIRQKGAKYWIIKHILYKSNKYLITFFFILSILASYLSSYLFIVIGKAIDIFILGDSNQVLNFTIIVLLIGIGAPIMGLFARVCREIIAQRIERTCRKEFYLNLLNKNQSFHDNQ